MYILSGTDSDDPLTGFELSPVQQRIWGNNAGVCWTRLRVELEGCINAAELRRAASLCVERHEIIRTVFQQLPEMRLPVQVPLETPSFDWASSDLGGLPASQQRSQINALFEQRPTVDLACGPLLLMHLVRLRPDAHVLLVWIASICCDVNAGIQFIREISELYQKSGGANTEVRQGVTPQYIDMAQWHADAVRADLLAGDQIRDDLRWGESSDKVVGRRREVRLRIKRNDIIGCQSLLDDEREDREIAVLAGWMKTLKEVKPDSADSIDCWRALPLPLEFERVVGPLSVPVRVSNPAVRFSLREDIERYVHDELLRTTSSEEVWTESFAPASMDVMRSSFTWCRQPDAWHAGAVRWSVESAFTDPPGCGSHLVCWETADACLMNVYRVGDHDDTFDATALLTNLRRNIRRGPDTLQTHLQAVELNARRTAVQFKTSLHGIVAAMQAAPDSVAVWDGDAGMTAAELMRKAARVAAVLTQSDVQSGDVVAVLLPRSADWLATTLGIWLAGAAYLPIDSENQPSLIAEILTDAKARAIVVGGEHATGDRFKVLSSDQLLYIHVSDLPADTGGLSVTAGVDAESPAYVIYTSGSSGKPKGVMVSHGALASYLSDVVTTYGGPGRGAIVSTSTAFDLSVTSLFAPLLQSVAVTIVGEHDTFQNLVSVIRDRPGQQFIKLTPAYLPLLLEQLTAGEMAAASRSLVVGGEALPAAFVERWLGVAPTAVIYNEYGPTETTVGCSLYTARAGFHAGFVPIGHSFAGALLYVLEDNGVVAPIGTEGEIFIGGPAVANGYVGQPQLTAERFLPDPFCSYAGGRMYRSGDFGRWSWQGLVYLGRRDEMVKVSGYRVELGHVRSALETLSGIRQAAVILNPASGQLAAFVTGAADAEAMSVRVRLAQVIPSYMVPASITIVPCLPLTANGKIDQQALLYAQSDVAIEPEIGDSQSPQEQLLCQIWCKVLGRNHVGVNDPFLAIGGDSIRSIQVQHQAQLHGIRFGVQDLLECQTVRELSKRLLDGNLPNFDAGLEQIRPFELISAATRSRLGPEIEDAYPISALQTATIYHSELDSDSGIYHNLNSYHLLAPFDEQHLRASVVALTSRHPILRTSYNLADPAGPLQLVHRMAEIPLTIEDVCHLTAEDANHYIEQWIEKESRNHFDWSKQPLLRLFVHRRTEHTMQFTVSKHHSILDGWSAAALMTDLFTEYLQRHAGQRTTLLPPTERYSTFIKLEREAVTQGSVRQFWNEELKDYVAPAVIERTGTRLAPDTPFSHIRTIPVLLPVQTVDRLKKLANSLGVALKSVLLAAHTRVVSLICGQWDVVSGIVSSGRSENAESDRVLGLFLNSLPFRMDISAYSSWKELVLGCAAKEAAIFPNRRFPLSELKRQQGGKMPFTTLFYLTNFHIFREFEGDSRIQVLNYTGFEETDLAFTSAFSIHPLSAELFLNLHFHIDRFTTEEANDVCAWYAHVLELMGATPGGTLDTNHVLRGMPGYRLPASGEIRRIDNRCVMELIDEQFDTRDDSVAVVCEDAYVTYGELNRRTATMAGWLKEAGIGPEMTVGVCLGRSPDLINAIIAILRVGAAYVPLEPSWPTMRISELVVEARCSLIISENSVVSPVAVVSVQEMLNGPNKRTELQNPSPQSLAYVIFTSGSAGRPKGVLVSHRSLAASTNARLTQYSPRPEKFLLVPSVAFDSSVGVIFWTLASGGSLIVSVEAHCRDVAHLARLLTEQSPTHLLCIPTLAKLILSHDNSSSAAWSLTTLIVAGEVCPGEWISSLRSERPQLKIWNEYGPTECTVWCTAYHVDSEAISSRVPIGRSVAGVQLVVVDGRRQPLPTWVSGELAVMGSFLARGYLNRTALTAQRFPTLSLDCNNDTVSQDRAYLTGDIVRYRPCGDLDILGRRDRQVKIAGHRIELGEVETVLNSVPGIAEAAVIVADDSDGVKRMVGYVSLQNTMTTRQRMSDEILKHIRERLPMQFVPKQYRSLERLPRNDRGKIDYTALASLKPADSDGESQCSEALNDHSTDPVLHVLSTIWASLLNIDKVRKSDDFFDIGGDSLLAIRMVAQISKIFGVVVPLKHFYENSTLSGAAGMVLSLAETAGQNVNAAADLWLQNSLPN